MGLVKRIDGVLKVIYLLIALLFISLALLFLLELLQGHMSFSETEKISRAQAISLLQDGQVASILGRNDGLIQLHLKDDKSVDVTGWSRIDVSDELKTCGKTCENVTYLVE
jgi:hypothetical protein